ncbi:MAG: hypothetical protein ACLFTQ_00380 [Candidatus Aenigmatarchaeota archaeon]
MINMDYEAIQDFFEDPTMEKYENILNQGIPPETVTQEIRKYNDALACAKQAELIEQEAGHEKWRNRGSLFEDVLRRAWPLAGDAVTEGIDCAGDAGKKIAYHTGEIGEEAGRTVGKFGKGMGHAASGIAEGVQEAEN